MRLRLERLKSPIAPLLLVTDEDGLLRALDFGDYEARTLRLLREHYRDCAIKEGPAPASLTRALGAYFEGNLEALTEIRTATGGTPFQREVWNALREIPAGCPISYGQLAARLGRPGACRAVGAANRVNPIAIVVPCHRVIGADGTLTGYGGGLPRKQWLLDHEAHFAQAGLSHRHHHDLRFGYRIERRPIDLEMGHDQLGRRVGQPLGKR